MKAYRLAWALQTAEMGREGHARHPWASGTHPWSDAPGHQTTLRMHSNWYNESLSALASDLCLQ